jgi:hypothetical protein
MSAHPWFSLKPSARRFLSISAIVFLAELLSGCCTSRLIDYSHKTKHDSFVPIALYQSADDHRLALEGTVHKAVPGESAWHTNPRENQLVRNQFCLMAADSSLLDLPKAGHEHEWLSMNSTYIHKLSANAELQSSLASAYHKVTDLPQPPSGSFTVPGTVHPSRRAAIAAIPLTVVADAATLPFQLILWGMLALGGHC